MSLESSAPTADQIVRNMLRWRSSFMAFLFDCIKTTNEGSGEIQSAPRLGYLKRAYECIEGNKISVIVKGRQMFFTHFMSAYYLWSVLFEENVRLGVMNQNEDKAADLLETRIAPLYERLPSGYPWPELKIKRLTIVNELNNSRILAVSSTSDALRSFTFSKIWLDEFGFQDNQDKTLRSAIPATKGKIGKLILVSTPVPKTLYEDLGRKELDIHFTPIVHMEGVTEYRNTRGHAVLYVHHTADPDRRSPEWIAETIKAEGELAYEVEYNLKWVLPSGKPVFNGFRRSTYCGDYRTPLEDSVLDIGWDFGGHHPACVITEKDSVSRHYLHKAVMGVDIDFDLFMDQMADMIEAEFPGKLRTARFYCDPAGAAVNGQGTAPPAQFLLGRRFGKVVKSIRSSPGDRVRAMKTLMNKMIGGIPAVLMHPMLGEAWHVDGTVEAGIMIEGFETGLVYDAVRGSGGLHKMTYKKDQWYEHIFDAWGYVFIYLYPGLMPSEFEERIMSRQGLVNHKKRRTLRR